MSRAIDADALEKEGWSLHRTIRVDKNTDEYQTKPLRKVPTIEPRCEACEAFNKTRLLIPQPQRKKGKWIPQNLNKSDGMISTAVYYYPKCSVCGANANYTNFCPNCGSYNGGENEV